MSCCWRTRFHSHLHSLVEDAAADLHHLQVLLLFIPRALDVGHPAALILLTGIDEIAHGAVFIEHLSAHKENVVKSEGTSVKHCTSVLTGRDCSGASSETCTSSYLPHEVVILEQVHVFWGQDPPRERTHLGSCFDPGF